MPALPVLNNKIACDQDMSCHVLFHSTNTNSIWWVFFYSSVIEDSGILECDTALLGEWFAVPRTLCVFLHSQRQGHLVLWNVTNRSPGSAATHSRRTESSNYVNFFFFRYEHFFKEFGTFRQECDGNILLKPSVHCDTNLPLYGNLQFGRKNCEEECHEKILSDAMFSQFCSYKMPTLADDTRPVKPVMNAAEYGQSVQSGDVTFNIKNSGGPSTVQSLSSIMLTLEASKNGVSMPPISKG